MGLHEAVTRGEVAGEEDVLLRSVERKKSLGNSRASHKVTNINNITNNDNDNMPSNHHKGKVTRVAIFFFLLVYHSKTFSIIYPVIKIYSDFPLPVVNRISLYLMYPNVLHYYISLSY